MLTAFRTVSLVEGLSFLVLLFVAMPLKYHFGYPQAVTVMGWTHGMLFMAYVYLATGAATRCNWSSGFQILVVLAGMTPFGCFMLDGRLKRESLQLATQSN